MFSYRNGISAAHGNTPFYLMHGRDPRLPEDLLLRPEADLRDEATQARLPQFLRLRHALTALGRCAPNVLTLGPEVSEADRRHLSKKASSSSCIPLLSQRVDIENCTDIGVVHTESTFGCNLKFIV